IDGFAQHDPHTQFGLTEPNLPPPPASLLAHSDFWPSPNAPSRCLCSYAGAKPVSPVPDPSPDAGPRWWGLRCLFCVALGRTISVLVTAAAAILRTTTIGRSVIAPLFETVIAIVPVALRRCCGNTADRQQGGAYKF